jgi:hypothetical protein
MMTLPRFVAKVGKRLGIRRFRAFGVGPGKTGTHSLAAIFDDCYRSVHEPDVAGLIPLVLRYGRGGEAAERDLAAYLRDFDRTRRLEMNSSLLNTQCAGLLARAFPDARFILLVRDCFTWANSAINQNEDDWGRRDAGLWPPHWRDWHAWEFGDPKTHAYAPEEAGLRERGHAPVRAFFALWARYYRTVLANVPAERLLVIRTVELGQRLGEIAAFVGLHRSTLDATDAFTFRTRKDHALLTTIPAAFVNRAAEEHCGDLMARFFPDASLDIAHFAGGAGRTTRVSGPPRVG